MTVSNWDHTCCMTFQTGYKRLNSSMTSGFTTPACCRLFLEKGGMYICALQVAWPPVSTSEDACMWGIPSRPLPCFVHSVCMTFIRITCHLHDESELIVLVAWSSVLQEFREVSETLNLLGRMVIIILGPGLHSGCVWYNRPFQSKEVSLQSCHARLKSLCFFRKAPEPPRIPQTS